MRYFFAFIFFSLSSLSLFAQGNTHYKKIISLDTSVEDKIIRVDSLLKQSSLSEKKNIFEAFPQWLYKNNKNHEKSVAYTEMAIAFFDKSFATESTIIQHQYYLLGRILTRLNKYKNSIDAHLSGIKVDPSSTQAGKSYTQIATNYKTLGDFHRAEDYYQLAERNLIANNEIETMILNGLGWCDLYKRFHTEEHFQQGLKKLYEFEKLTKENHFSERTLYFLYKNLGDFNNEPESYNHEKAFSYYKKAEETNYNVLGSLIDIGNLFLKSDFSKAKSYYEKILEVSNYDNDVGYYAYNNLGYCHLYEFSSNTSNYYTPTKNEDEILIALDYYRKGIATIIKEPVEKISFKMINDVSDGFDKSNLLEYFKDMAIGFYTLYQINEKQENLNKAISLFKKADYIFDLLTLESSGYESKLYWREQANALYKHAIDASFFSSDLEHFFYFIEKNKNYVLQQDLLYIQTKIKNNIPSTLLKEERKLKKQIHRLQSKELGLKEDHDILETERSLERIQDSIMGFNPDYLKNNPSRIPSLKTTQAKIKDNELIITYSLFNDEGYILSITKDNIKKEKITDLKNIVDITHDYLELISKPFSSKKELERFQEIGNTLFIKLFPEKTKQLFKNKTKLIIAPEGVLSKIPFEALITNNKKYLIQEKEINYILSNAFASSTIENDKVYSSSTISIFAPVNFKDGNLPTLNGSEKEVLTISDLLESKHFLFQDASKVEFKKELISREIIHLATHVGTSKNDEKWIAFHDSIMTLKELYLGTNNTNLVILNACQTNTGNYIKGEGIMSVSRAFFKTGTQNVVASLWNVNDKATVDIITHFYNNLEKGLTSSESLRHAKLAYLNQHALSDASPYYWAPMILTGKSRVFSVQSSNSIHYPLIISVIVIIGLLLFILKKKR